MADENENQIATENVQTEQSHFHCYNNNSCHGYSPKLSPPWLLTMTISTYMNGYYSHSRYGIWDTMGLETTQWG